MEPDINVTKEQPGKPADLVDTISGFWLWCVPAFLIVLGVVLSARGILSPILADVVYVISTAWIGIGCFINGRRCGRVHCKIDGILFPALSIVGVLGVVGLIALNWSLYWIAFLVILIVGFSVELFWRKYV